jgi:hypothetical protein
MRCKRRRRHEHVIKEGLVDDKVHATLIAPVGSHPYHAGSAKHKLATRIWSVGPGHIRGAHELAVDENTLHSWYQILHKRCARTNHYVAFCFGFCFCCNLL